MSEESTIHLDSLAPLIGHMTIAWTDVQFWIFLIFWRLLGRAAQAEAIFFTLRSDRAQRDITMALAREVLEPWPETRDRVIEAIAKVGEAATRRNSVIHAMWITNHPDLTVSIWPGTSPRLEGKDITQELEKTIGELKQISFELGGAQKEVKEIMSGQPRAPALGGLLGLFPQPRNALLPNVAATDPQEPQATDQPPSEPSEDPKQSQ